MRVLLELRSSNRFTSKTSFANCGDSFSYLDVTDFFLLAGSFPCRFLRIIIVVVIILMKR